MKKIILLLSLFSVIISFAQTTEDYTIQSAITTQTSPPKITFTWPLDTTAINYTIARKPLSSSSWMVVGGLASHGTHWTDSNLVLGAAYEYQIMKSSTFDAYSYFYAGIQAPPIEIRGKLILLVDSTFVDSLAIELYQLTKDLIGDGWQVIRHDVSRTDAVTHVKGLIVADYNVDPINTKAVFIFGHVPVPYSGDINPDGHPDHHGAWGADVYYADMDGIWTDNIINDSLASRTQNRNIPGDGKFDQSTLPTDVELQIGRVDLANMPSFAFSEQELLRRYLVKDHDYRVKNFSVRPRALV
ncbi:MAG: fibronectin type III domain-containing protein, partial [Bacteroidota bacterium]